MTNILVTLCVLQVLSQLDRHPVVVGSGRSEPLSKLTRLASAESAFSAGTDLFQPRPRPWSASASVHFRTHALHQRLPRRTAALSHSRPYCAGGRNESRRMNANATAAPINSPIPPPR